MADFIKREALAELLGVSQSRISQLVTEGVLLVDGHGKYPKEENLVRAVKYLRDRAFVGDIKRKKIEKEVELLDLEIGKRSGQQLGAAEVERAWAGIVLLARQRFLRIGNKLAPRIPFLKTEKEIETEIQREIDEALGELSRTPDYG